MSYWVDIKGQANLIIYSEKTPRVGEQIILAHDSFPGQEEELKFKVVNIVYNLGGHRLTKEMPIVVLEPTS